MVLDLQFKIKNNPNYGRYIRENSHWYKFLNRDPNNFQYFKEEVKEKYRLRPQDKIGNIAEKLNMIKSLMDIIK